MSVSAELNAESLRKFKLGRSGIEALTDAHVRLIQHFLPFPGTARPQSARSGRDWPNNVVGIGVGAYEHGAAITGLPGMKVLVESAEGLDSAPEHWRIPSEIAGIPINVLEVGKIMPQVFRRRHRPMPAGVSIGSGKVNEVGTLGCVVRDHNDHYMLSNNHVLALENSSPKSAPIVQPSRYDGGSAKQDIVAKLSRFVPLQFGSASNRVDAAIAAVSDLTHLDARVVRNSHRRDALTAPDVPPVVGDSVQKSGRTTGWTKGEIRIVGLSVNVPYSGNVARFDNQFAVVGQGGSFSSPGDSGSLVTTDPDNHPVGLLFAAGNGITFCNRVDDVLAALDVQIVY